MVLPPCGLHLVLVEPEIPPNTGNIARLCLAAGARLHLLEPLGFSLEEKALRRAGMDYWRKCDVQLWPSWAAWREAHRDLRCWFFSAKAERSFWTADFRAGEALIFGRETKGLPESLLRAHPGQCLRLPMVEGVRGLNLATSAGIALYEAWRVVFSAGASRGGMAVDGDGGVG